MQSCANRMRPPSYLLRKPHSKTDPRGTTQRTAQLPGSSTMPPPPRRADRKAASGIRVSESNTRVPRPSRSSSSVSGRPATISSTRRWSSHSARIAATQRSSATSMTQPSLPSTAPRATSCRSPGRGVSFVDMFMMIDAPSCCSFGPRTSRPAWNKQTRQPSTSRTRTITAKIDAPLMITWDRRWDPREPTTKESAILCTVAVVHPTRPRDAKWLPQRRTRRTLHQ